MQALESNRPPALARRDLFRACGTASAAMLLPLAVQGEKDSRGGDPVRRVRLGVVGGNFGASFYWHEHPHCTVEAVSDLVLERRQRLMKVYRCPKWYESLEKLILDKDVEAVAVFTPAPDHVRHCVSCLRAGKHVICAVPACMSIAEAELLLDTVRQTGLTYMMAETSWYHQSVITARQWFQEGKFGRLFYTEAEYHHPGLESLFADASGQRTWRYGFPPMHYPTHCTAYLVGVTGERLTQVSCMGWGDDSPVLKDNAYHNPFWNGTALFNTSGGHAFRVAVYWKAAVGGCERGQWLGDKLSFFEAQPNGLGAIIRRTANQTETDDAGFVRQLPQSERYAQPQWWQTEMLPERLRHASGHDGSHTFLTHEFVSALVQNRRPAVDIYAALAMTVPGIVGHQSARKGGEQLKVPQFDRPG
jgi:predicted dehydrogenase